MIIAKDEICPICEQEINITLDGEKECLSCGYIEKIEDWTSIEEKEE